MRPKAHTTVWALVGLITLIGGGIAALFWSLGLQAPQPSSEDRDRGVIAFVSPESAGAMLGWVTIEDAFRSGGSGNVTMSLSVAATSAAEISVVIGGTVASASVRCFSDGGTVLNDLTWDDLNVEQQDAILRYEMNRPVTGRVSSIEQDRTSDETGATTAVEKSSYIVIQPGLLKDYSLTTEIEGADRSYTGLSGAVECSFPSTAFWEDSGSERVLSVPDVVGARGSEGGAFGDQPYLYVHRRVLVDASSEDLIYSSVEPVFDDASTARFLEHWSNYDYSRPSMVAIAELTAVMSPRTSELSRQLTFLAIGLLVATEIALLPALARSIVNHVRGS